MRSTAPGIWISDPQAYRKRLFELLGDRDPIQVMSETSDTLAAIVSENPPEVMRARPFEGKWTPNEIIGHLVDAEWVCGYRLRQMLAEKSPPILGMDQDLWVAAQQYNEQEPADLVITFRAIRGFNLSLWRRLSAADLKRSGMHNERGPESLGMMLPMLAGHDLWHIEQITRYLKAVKHA